MEKRVGERGGVCVVVDQHKHCSFFFGTMCVYLFERDCKREENNSGMDGEGNKGGVRDI